MGVEVNKEDMKAAIENFITIAGCYGTCIDVLATQVCDKVDPAFESGNNSPKAAWQDCLDMIWDVMADSQNKVNAAADNLIDYSKEVSDIDDATSEDLEKQVDDLDEATRPEVG